MGWTNDVELVDEWMANLMGPKWAESESARDKLAEFLYMRYGKQLKESNCRVVEAKIKGCLQRLRGPVSVSLHAVQRFQQRTGSKKRVEVITRQIRELAIASEPVKPVEAEHRNVKRLIRHRFKRAEFRRSAQWILVIEDGEVSTVYEAKGREWKSV